jgi:hypothetical protein
MGAESLQAFTALCRAHILITEFVTTTITFFRIHHTLHMLDMVFVSASRARRESGRGCFQQDDGRGSAYIFTMIQ